VTPRVVETATGPVEVAEVGEGPVVLVLHGTPGDWSQAVALAEDLAGTHRVLLPSRPGYGRTPLSTGRTIAQQAQAYAALLDALGIDRAAVVGISGGGPSARSFAVHHPERCSHLVLLCAVAAQLVTVPRAMRLLAAVPGLWEVGARVAARQARRLVEPVLDDLGPAEQDAVRNDPRAREDLVAFLTHNARVRTSVRGMRNDFRCFHGQSEREPWPAVTSVPTLVLHGDVDPVVPLTHGEDNAAGIPGAVLEVLEGAGHAFPLSLRRTVSPRVQAFLQVTAKESA
jgi:pimeloyl-ACP methyl ester carboxylesterase